VPRQRDRAWVGIDVGKTHHWACVVDDDGKRLLSVRIANDEAEIVTLVANTVALASQLIWLSTSSAPRRRCCLRYWLALARPCVTPRAGWSQR
jgi:hypothetical protein